MNQPANLRVGRRFVAMIVAGWIAATIGTPSAASAAAGDVLKHWNSELTVPFGVGYTGKVWISNAPDPDRDYEFLLDGVGVPPVGVKTGRVWTPAWVGTFAADMAYLPGPKLLCQVNVGGDNGIYCWNPDTGAVAGSIVGAFPWTVKSQRGLAYRAADDTFYIGGWHQRIIYRIKGLSYGESDKGTVISQCMPVASDGATLTISGLAYNAVSNILWVATNGDPDTIYELNADTCVVLSTLPHPDPGGFKGGGLEIDENGNLWMVSQGSSMVYLVDSGRSANTPSVAAIRDAVDPQAFRNDGLWHAFEVRLRDIERSIAAGKIVPALDMLRALRMRLDGCGAAPDLDDWIIQCKNQSEVRPKLDNLTTSLAKKLGG